MELPRFYKKAIWTRNTQIVPQYFNESRHIEEINGIVEENEDVKIWQECSSQQRAKTVSVALCMCMNIGVDPPDPTPKPPHEKRATMEAWVSPRHTPKGKVSMAITQNLKKAYEKVQPRARYLFLIDETVENVEKVCSKLRRAAGSDRVLFHYNGHGVPRPTYVPLSLFDLQDWMGTPSVYVWDMNSSETAIKWFNKFAEMKRIVFETQQRERLAAYEVLTHLIPGRRSSLVERHRFEDSIHLGASKEGQALPLRRPELPADLFSACLTTPIQTSIIWRMVELGIRNQYPEDILDKLPGNLMDRRTFLGQLTWIFTAITDAIAWDTVPRRLFQRLYRQDLLLASLFRNFLLADRVMHENGCDVVSYPALPRVCSHPLWETWDFFLDVAISLIDEYVMNQKSLVQLAPHDYLRSNKSSKPFAFSNLQMIPGVYLGSPPTAHSIIESEPALERFFVDQLQGFKLWLSYGVENVQFPPSLPVIIQGLHSQTYRMAALELLANFMDFGAWAVGQAFGVGAYQFMTKMLNTQNTDQKLWLSFIWAKILAVAPAAQAELFKESDDGPTNSFGRREPKFMFFVRMLQDAKISPMQRVLPAYVLAQIMHRHAESMQDNIGAMSYLNACASLLMSYKASRCKALKLWLLIGLGQAWADNDELRWIAIRHGTHQLVYEQLDDKVPEVRAAALFALGRLIKNRSSGNPHAQSVDEEVVARMCDKCTFDGSVLVRMELVVALQWYTLDFTQLLAKIVTVMHDKTKIEEAQNEALKTFRAKKQLRPEVGIDAIRIQPTPSISSRIIHRLSSRNLRVVHTFHRDLTNYESSASSVTREESLILLRARSKAIIRYLEGQSALDGTHRFLLSLYRLTLDPMKKVAKTAQEVVTRLDEMVEKGKERMREKVETYRNAPLRTKAEKQKLDAQKAVGLSQPLLAPPKQFLQSQEEKSSTSRPSPSNSVQITSVTVLPTTPISAHQMQVSLSRPKSSPKIAVGSPYRPLTSQKSDADDTTKQRVEEIHHYIMMAEHKERAIASRRLRRKPEAGQQQMLRESEVELGMKIYSEKNKEENGHVKQDPNWNPDGEGDALLLVSTKRRKHSLDDTNQQISQLLGGTERRTNGFQRNGDLHQRTNGNHVELKRDAEPTMVASTPAIVVPREVIQEKEKIPVGKFHPQQISLEEAVTQNPELITETETRNIDTDDGEDVEILARVTRVDTDEDPTLRGDVGEPEALSGKREDNALSTEDEGISVSPQDGEFQTLPREPSDEDVKTKKVVEMSAAERERRARARERERLLRGKDAGGLGTGMAPANPMVAVKLSPIRELEKENGSTATLGYMTSQNGYANGDSDSKSQLEEKEDCEEAKGRVRFSIASASDEESQSSLKKPMFTIGCVSPEAEVEMFNRSSSSQSGVMDEETIVNAQTESSLTGEASRSSLVNMGKYRVDPNAPFEFTPRRNLREKPARKDSLESWNPYEPHFALLCKEREPLSPIVTTNFVAWCGRSFTDPLLHLFKMPESSLKGGTLPDHAETESRRKTTIPLDGIEDEMVAQGVEWNLPENTEEVSINPSDWSCYVNEDMVEHTRVEFSALKPGKDLLTSRFIWETPGIPQCIAMSRLRPFMYATDGKHIDLYCYEGSPNSLGLRRSFVVNDNNIFNEESIHQLLMVNEMSKEMIAACSESGLFRLWDLGFNPYGTDFESSPELVTAAYLLGDQRRIRERDHTGDNTTFQWDQSLGRMIVAGNVPVVRIWDAHAEKTIRDMRIDRRLRARLLSCDLERSGLITVGFETGEVHVIDSRMDERDGLLTILKIHSHELAAISLHSPDSSAASKLVVASTDGRLEVYDPRYFKVIACLTSSSSLKVIDVAGRPLTTLQDASSHFSLGTTSLCWHPLRFLLAIASRSGHITTFGLPSSRHPVFRQQE